MTDLGGGEQRSATWDDLVVEDNPASGDIEYLEARTVEATIAAAGVDDDRDLAIILRDPEGRIVAGVSGGTWGGVCELTHLWVDESMRGRGVGSALIRSAELEATRRSCTQVVLFTHDVQAPGFYETLGYETCGVLEDYPAGSAARLFRKQLDQPTPGN